MTRIGVPSSPVPGCADRAGLASVQCSFSVLTTFLLTLRDAPCCDVLGTVGKVFSSNPLTFAALQNVAIKFSVDCGIYLITQCTEVENCESVWCRREVH